MSRTGLALMLTSMMMLSLLAGCLGSESKKIDEGVIEPPIIEGCTDPIAINFDEEATQDDGSCEFEEAPIEGCTDPEATNHDPTADVDDGSCEYPPPPVFGCTDSSAENYDPSADEDDGSCIYTPYSMGFAEYTKMKAVGEQRILILLVNFTGQPLTDTPAEALSAWESVGDWFSNVSYGQVWFNITIAGPYTFPTIHRDSPFIYEAAMDDGYNLSNFDRFIVAGHMHSGSSSFSTLGIDSLNITDSSGDTHDIIGSRLVINTPMWNSFNGLLSSSLHHEMAHSFGLSHAGFYSSLTGQTFEYGTHYSIMGMSASLADPSLADKLRLGWIPESAVITATESGQHSMTSILRPDASGIRIPIPGDDTGERFYYLTTRESSDKASVEISLTHPDDDQPGQTGGIGTESIDATPETHVWKGEYDTNLHEGRTWTDPTGTIHITLVSAQNETVMVEVIFTDSNSSSNTAPIINGITAIMVSASPYVYEFEINASDAEQNDLSYFWNFGMTNNGKYEPGRHGSGESISHEYANNGARRVLVFVSDRYGEVTTGWVDLGGNVNQIPHLSEFSFTETSGGISFDSNASDDNPMIYHWNFGDGAESISRRALHKYAAEGDYTVTLTITDGEHTITHSETINSSWPGLPPNIPAIANAGENQTVSAGSDVNLAQNGSYDPDNLPIGGHLRYLWTCVNCTGLTDNGDGTAIVRGLSSGVWEFVLSAYDGRDYSTDSVWITVV